MYYLDEKFAFWLKAFSCFPSLLSYHLVFFLKLSSQIQSKMLKNKKQISDKQILLIIIIYAHHRKSTALKHG